MHKEIPGQPEGTIYSFTRVEVPPITHEEFAPYTVALVDVEVGKNRTRRLLMRLTDWDPDREIKIGERVEVVTRVLQRQGRRGLIIYGYAARPPLEEGIDNFNSGAEEEE